jgi:hypothetical protein
MVLQVSLSPSVNEYNLASYLKKMSVAGLLLAEICWFLNDVIEVFIMRCIAYQTQIQ